jgi:SAM-dependent methyltransferase/uncharacterized protein YbaR (Trm112 family)
VKLTLEALAALACPRCAGSLEERADSLVCGRCGVPYSFVGDIPCLVPEPGFWRARVVQRLDEYVEITTGRLAEIEHEQNLPALLPRTRARLGRIASAMKAEGRLVETMLAPMRVGALSLPPATAFSVAPGADTLALLKCYENVFRDWAWGDAESETALRLAETLMSQGGAGRAVPRLALFGAGAGRLAADVHRALEPQQTLALDVNPLPLLIADRLVRGETLEAHEFPVAPRGDEDVAVPRQLRCPFPVRAGLTFLFADGLAPPFSPGSLDVALTPWFIDVVDADPRVTAAVIGRVLKPGGLWVNFGPLRFAGATPRLYQIEEIMDVVAASGFELCGQLREQVPYFASPQSGFHRLELVYGFAARKIAEAPAPAVPATVPAWATDPRLPVPPLSEWASIRRSAVLANGVLSMIDGQRSIADLSQALGQAWNVDPRTLEGQLQAFLLRLIQRH